MNNSNQLLEEYNEKLSEVLDELLPTPPYFVIKKRVIHDLVWGSISLMPWEALLLDTPLCQRLRFISQLGTAFLTYPTATHHRFSHTLGVLYLAGRLINSLKEKSELSIPQVEIGKKEINTVKLAAILHDIGHCFFSHASEKVLFPLLLPLMTKLNLSHVKPHEFFSALIIDHPKFKKFWNDYVIPLFQTDDEVPQLEMVKKMILSIPIANNYKFLGEIISGPFDVDKLEYLYRDSRMTGLSISYDLERYFQKIEVVQTKGGDFHLAMGDGGIRTMEQHIFSRLMLFSFLYHHHKVLASDSLLEDLLKELMNSKDYSYPKLNHPIDFLKYTDNDILSVSTPSSPRAEKLKKSLLYRNLPKRVFIIGKDFLSDEKSLENWSLICEKLHGDYDSIVELRKNIINRIKKINHNSKITIDDLHFFFPHPPSIESLGKGIIINIAGNHERLDNYIDLKGWKESYINKKLRGYFYASPSISPCAGVAIEEFFLDEYGIRFNNKAKYIMGDCTNNR
jgi:HD superfamily phosphohydrolase